jgi:regulator of RNase E activity RraB
MKATTLIPVRRNDGSPVPADEIEDIIQRFVSTFGGCTVDGRTKGYWVDNATVYEDECLKVVVVCDAIRRPELEALVRDIGLQLGQLAMYLEIDNSTEVQIMRIQ